MKKYILYPGLGKITPFSKLQYLCGRQLASCFKVPYSECLDTDNPAIKKVIEFNKKVKGPPSHLISLLPNELGIYKTPTGQENKIIIAEGFAEAVNKNG